MRSTRILSNLGNFSCFCHQHRKARCVAVTSIISIVMVVPRRSGRNAGTKLEAGFHPLIIFLSLSASIVAVGIWWKGLPSNVSLLTIKQVEACEPGIIYRGPEGLPALRTRNNLGALLQKRNFTDGAEVGVQKGYHAKTLLQNWKSCKSFKLIDLWAHQKNYEEGANVDDAAQEGHYQETKKLLEPFKDKTEFLRMLSVEAAQKIPDRSLDFVYIDARHDYCGVREDIQAYYPKLRPGGILAGHDYLDVLEVKKLNPEEDWSLCLDGTSHPESVKGAVEEFAEMYGLVISIMYAENAFFASWMVQKPTRMECVKQVGEFGSQVSSY